MPPSRSLGQRHSREDRAEQVVGADVIGQGLVAEHHPMTQDIGRKLPGIHRDDVITATQIGPRPGRQHDVDRRARAGTEGQIAGQFGKPHHAWVTGRTRERDGILDHSGVDADRVDGGLQPPKSVRVEDRVDPLGRADHPLDDDVFLCGRGISDEHLEHEPVDLCLGERIGALGLDGVLGGPIVT